MFLDKIHGLQLLVFLLVIYYNCWRSLLKVFLRRWLSVLPCSGSAGMYWKRDAILAPLWWFVLETDSHWGMPYRGCFFNYCYLLLLILLLWLILSLLLLLLSSFLLLLQCAYLYIYLFTEACVEHSQIFGWRNCKNC